MSDSFEDNFLNLLFEQSVVNRSAESTQDVNFSAGYFAAQHDCSQAALGPGYLMAGGQRAPAGGNGSGAPYPSPFSYDAGGGLFKCPKIHITPGEQVDQTVLAYDSSFLSHRDSPHSLSPTRSLSPHSCHSDSSQGGDRYVHEVDDVEQEIVPSTERINLLPSPCGNEGGCQTEARQTRPGSPCKRRYPASMEHDEREDGNGVGGDLAMAFAVDRHHYQQQLQQLQQQQHPPHHHPHYQHHYHHQQQQQQQQQHHARSRSLSPKRTQGLAPGLGCPYNLTRSTELLHVSSYQHDGRGHDSPRARKEARPSVGGRHYDSLLYQYHGLDNYRLAVPPVVSMQPADVCTHSPFLRSDVYPPLDWPLPSQSGSYDLRLESQPRSHHRAHYETEGSRGAVKAQEGSHIRVKLYGYSKTPLMLQLFIGTADERPVRPHPFYQVHRVTGKTVLTPSRELVLGDTKVLDIPMLPENGMLATIDCAGILKLRNADIELRSGETDVGRKNTRVRLVFRTHVPQAGGAEPVSLQVASIPIECSQRSAQKHPLIERLSINSCSVMGGDEMVITGSNFLPESKVIFTQKGEDGRTVWEKEVDLTMENFQSARALVRVPPYLDRNVAAPVSVQVYVCNGKQEKSQNHTLTYLPLTGVPIKQETPCEFAHQIVHTFRPASPLPATTYGGSRASPSPPQPMAFSVSRGVVSPQPLVVPARLSSSPSELITISARLSPSHKAAAAAAASPGSSPTLAAGSGARLSASPGRSSAFSSAAGVPSPRSCSPSASGGGGGGGGGIFSPLRGVAHAAPANVAAFGPAGQQQAFATDVPDRASRLSFGPDCGAQPPTLLVGQPARWPEGGGLRRPVAISGAAPPSAGRADASRSYRMAQPTPPLPPSGHRSGLDASGQRTPSAYGAMPASGGAEVAGSKGSPGERPPFGPAGGRGATCGLPFGEAPAWNPAAVKEEPPDGDVFGIKEFSMLEDVSEIIRRDLNDLPAS
ncbi:uncharacterized protein LOC116945985 [Petromyzon marinus]|uniref:uncharacterized protein LOC116945985 n=1 Tax=Petromyzon marinus TaxID=7757 RepID=UPI003F6EBF29